MSKEGCSNLKRSVLSCPVLRGSSWALCWPPPLSEPVTQGPKLGQALRDTSSRGGGGSGGVASGCAKMGALSDPYHWCWPGPCSPAAESQRSPNHSIQVWV